MKSLKTLVHILSAMEKITIRMAVVLAMAFGLILGSIGSASLVYAQAQQQANTTGGGNMTGKTTETAGGGNMTSPTTAKAANETAGMQSGAGNATQSGAGNATQSGNQTGNNTGNPLAKIPIIGKIFGGK